MIDYERRKRSLELNREFIDHDDYVSWLITWFQNRTFYIKARNESEAKKKGRNHIKSRYDLSEELLRLACVDMKVEESGRI